jgi:hypothetical protein
MLNHDIGDTLWKGQVCMYIFLCICRSINLQQSPKTDICASQTGLFRVGPTADWRGIGTDTFLQISLFVMLLTTSICATVVVSGVAYILQLTKPT